MIQKEYISKNHSKFLIKYHMIPVCKYRKKLLIGSVEYDMKQIMQKISNFSDFDIEVMETDKDHIHMMICSEPKLSPLQIVRRLKQMSTTATWKKHENYLRHIFYRENTFWTDGYFVSSVQNVSQETIKIHNSKLLYMPGVSRPQKGKGKCEGIATYWGMGRFV